MNLGITKNAVIGNLGPTLAGLVSGILLYLNQAGANLPTTLAELKALALSAAIIYLGAVSKSANVGSKA